MFVIMKSTKMMNRLSKDRPMVSVTLRMPQDVVDDLKRVAPLKGMSGYQPLIRSYVGQCLRKDLRLLDDDSIALFVQRLKENGVDESKIQRALAELN